MSAAAALPVAWLVARAAGLVAFDTETDALSSSSASLCGISLATAPGEAVVVTAGSSGVGTAAIQIARYIGASSVVATTRAPAVNGASASPSAPSSARCGSNSTSTASARP